jgi:hypothetical protein
MDYPFIKTPSQNKIYLTNKERVVERLNKLRSGLDPKQATLITDKSLIGWVFGARLTKATSEKSILPNCVAFISTNSISQGEQVCVLWKELFRKKINIHFAYRSFVWTSESSGTAQIHCVIIGFGNFEAKNKYLFYKEGDAVHSIEVKNISPYLIPGSNTLIQSRSVPISPCPNISYGSMMIDKKRGASDELGLTFGKEQRLALIEETPELKPFIRRFYGSEEFINNQKRWCLWLVDISPDIINKSSLLRKRIDNIRKFRQKSSREQTQKLAQMPMLFGENRQPNSKYLLIPKVSSEQRNYVPINFMSSINIASGSTLVIPNANIYHFGILTSKIHTEWLKLVGGRMKSDYQYSNTLVYNNFPWPTPTEKQKENVIKKAQRVLDVRKLFSKKTFAVLYHRLTMPPPLAKAHHELDKAVERCYRKKPFKNDCERLTFLLELYEKLTTGNLWNE